MHSVKVLKALVGLIFLAVVAMIAVNLVTHSGKRLRVPPALDDRDSQKIDKKEKVEFFEARGKKRNLQIKAEKHYLGEDENYHLEGNVEIVFLDKKEEEDIFLYGEEVVYDSEWTRFRFRDEAKVRFKDLIINVTSLEYLADGKIFKSVYPVSFSSERLNGSGQRITYSQKSMKLTLEEKVHLEMITNLSPTIPILLEGDRFEFEKRGKRGKLIGNVRLRHGESQVTADALDFQLTGKSENIKYMHFEGKVHALLFEESEEESSNLKQTALPLYGKRREVEAEEIVISGIPDLPQIRHVLGQGECVFTFISGTGLMTQIQAESVEFFLSRKGKLEKFSALGQARISERDEKADLKRQIDGEIMAVEENRDILNVRGKKNDKARLKTSDSDVSAQEIKVFLNNNNLEASGDVKVILTQGNEENQSIGFFSGDHPVFITTQSMRYIDTQKRFLFSGGSKLWQQKEMLYTEEMAFNKETGNVNANGKVRATFPYRAEEGEEDVIEVLSEKMQFDSNRRIVRYEGNCSLKVKDIRMRARSIFIQSSKGDGRMKRITAIDNVVIVQNENQGRGEKAVFNVNRDIIILTGNPVLIVKDQGKTEGFKLTFHISDGKIVVENKDRERSVTVIKS